MLACNKMIRYLCSELVRITCLDGSQKRSQWGNLEEIGTHFAEVLTDRAYPREASLRIASETYQIDGVVESCALQHPLGYFVRVKLAPESSWSKEQFTPQHLLAVDGPSEPKVFSLSVASGY